MRQSDLCPLLKYDAFLQNHILLYILIAEMSIHFLKMLFGMCFGHRRSIQWTGEIFTDSETEKLVSLRS